MPHSRSHHTFHFAAAGAELGWPSHVKKMVVDKDQEPAESPIPHNFIMSIGKLDPESQ
jgi:hypothetical protein